METITKMFVVLLCVFGVLLLLLEFSNLYGGNWATVGVVAAPFILLIAFFGFVLTMIKLRG